MIRSNTMTLKCRGGKAQEGELGTKVKLTELKLLAFLTIQSNAPSF